MDSLAAHRNGRDLPWMVQVAAAARESFEPITRLLVRSLHAPLAMFCPLAEDEPIEAGFGLSNSARNGAGGAFTAACVAVPDLLVVPDAQADGRFCRLPSVQGPPFVRFYAGAPVRAPDRSPVAALAVVDTRVRELTPDMLTTLRDAASVAEEMLLLLTLSARDRVTGLLNRGLFEEVLDSEWRRAIRERGSLALVMIDLDNFKDYNDTLGHPAGDRVLRQVAGLVARHYRRAGDAVFRYGGEEFAVLLPLASAADAVRLTESLRAEIEREDVPHPSRPSGRVTISAGVAAVNPRPGDERRDLVQAADDALYRAKAAGRDCVRQA